MIVRLGKPVYPGDIVIAFTDYSDLAAMGYVTEAIVMGPREAVETRDRRSAEVTWFWHINWKSADWHSSIHYRLHDRAL